MKNIALSVLLTGLLAACAQTPTEQAAIEDHTQQPAASTQEAKKDGMETQGMATAGADGQALDAAMKMPPKDAAGPLGKRVVYFDFDSATIRAEDRSVVEAHAAFVKSHQQAKIVLQGNTDERGSREYNLALGQRRADSVGQAMKLLGVDAAQIETVSFGEEKPAADGHDEAAWGQNRRVQFVYDGE